MLADSESTVVINGDKHLAGRLCSVIAKMLLNGNRVILVNAEKILMSGSRANILKENELRLEITSRVHPKHGPFHPRRPDTYMEKWLEVCFLIKNQKAMLPKNFFEYISQFLKNIKNPNIKLLIQHWPEGHYLIILRLVNYVHLWDGEK